SRLDSHVHTWCRLCAAHCVGSDPDRRPGKSRSVRPVTRLAPEESLAERYARLARETSGRRGTDLGLRALDLLLAALFLLVSLPLIVPIGVAIVATSGPPLFYRGERVGRGGRIFTMLKFRTLKRGAEARLGPFL